MHRKYFLVAVFFVLFVVGFLVSSTFLTFRDTISQVIVTPNPGTGGGSAAPSPTPDPLAPYGVLLLGLRGDNSTGGFLTDTMILGVVDSRVRKISLISIPRDLWVPIPVSSTEKIQTKINAAYAIGLDDRKYTKKEAKYTGAAGGGELAKSVVEQVFGIPVRYFVSLDFKGFEKSIDILGGVELDVTLPFDDKFFPITGKEEESCGKSEEEIKAVTATMSGYLLEQQFTCRYEELKFDKGVTHMDGLTALKFARSRHSEINGSDFARSIRQKQIMLAVKNKVFQLGFLPRAIPFIQSLSGDLRTDISLDVMRNLASQASDLKTYVVSSLSLSTDNALMETFSADRQYILIPKSGQDDWQSIRDFVSSQITKASPSAKP